MSVAAGGLPTGPRGRALALVIAGLLLAAVWLVAVVPLIEWHDALAERLVQRQALADRMEQMARTLPQLRQEATAGEGAPPTLLEGGSDSVAGAALQSQVQEIAARAGATLSSAELLPVEAAGTYRRVSLRISANGSWAALVALLGALEEATPRMLVDEMRVQSAPSIAPGAGRPMAMTLTVVAFRAGNEVAAR